MKPNDKVIYADCWANLSGGKNQNIAEQNENPWDKSKSHQSTIFHEIIISQTLHHEDFQTSKKLSMKTSNSRESSFLLKIP